MLRHERYVFQASEEEAIFEEGRVKNYSPGGALFESKTPYSLGDILKLEITIPGWQRYKNEFYREDRTSRPEPVVILACVLRVEVLVPDQLYEIGVQFVGIDEGDRWALVKQIKTQLKRY
jgi:hypothetical protein